MKKDDVRVLIIEDNPADARLVCEMLKESAGRIFKTAHAVLLDQGLKKLEREKFDVLLLDLGLPDSRGLEGLERIAAQNPVLPIIVLTGNNDEKLGLEAIHEQASDYLVKGRIDTDILVRGILYAIERKQSEVEIRNLNEALKLRAAELEAINKELEDFDYSVSHDLKGPLRAIDGLSRLLLQKHFKEIDAEGKYFLTLIAGRVKKMNELIEDLLNFSRLNRKKISPAEVNMADLAQGAFEELTPALSGRTIEFTVKPLPSTHGDSAMMRAVIINLLSNSIKFTQPKEAPVIEVGGWTKNGENIYYIKDNGIGFDMKYAATIFEIFERLHKEEEYEGTGAGLAIVRRIIQRHGGRVWAEGKSGEGATFYFTLPNPEPLKQS